MTLRRNATDGGYTLVEVMVALALGSILAVMVAALAMYGYRSFVALGNYADLDAQSRNALDVIGRELRQATGVVSHQTNLPVRYVTFTNALAGGTVKLIYDADLRNVVMEKTGQPARTLLTSCDRWDFALYSRAPAMSKTNITFTTASQPACKLVSLSWKCSRTMLRSQRLNTESVQTAQIVLRNK